MLLFNNTQISAFISEPHQTDERYHLFFPHNYVVVPNDNAQPASAIAIFRANYHLEIVDVRLRALNAVVKTVAVMRSFVDPLNPANPEVVQLAEEAEQNDQLTDADIRNFITEYIEGSQALMNAGALNYFKTNHTTGHFDAELPSVFRSIVDVHFPTMNLDVENIYKLIHFSSKKILLNLIWRSLVDVVEEDAIPRHLLTSAIIPRQFDIFEQVRIRSMPAGLAHLGVIHAFIEVAKRSRLIYYVQDLTLLARVEDSYLRVLENPIRYHIGKHYLTIGQPNNYAGPSKVECNSLIHDIAYYLNELNPKSTLAKSKILPKDPTPNAMWATYVNAYNRMFNTQMVTEAQMQAMRGLMNVGQGEAGDVPENLAPLGLDAAEYRAAHVRADAL